MASAQRYVGLTDDPQTRKQQHGNPRGFRMVRKFRTENAARKWEKEMLERGYKGDIGGKGWRYGYTFSVK